MKNLWLALVAAALAFCGCSSDDKEIVNPVPEDGLTLLTEVGASFGLEARTSLDGNKVVWSTGDKISVWSDEQPSPVVFYIQDGVGSTNATFRVAANSEGVRGTKFYALYPGTTTTSITLPTTQADNGVENFASNVSPMYATTNGQAPEYAQSFQFQNICGILPITLSADKADRLSRIVVSSSDPVAGTMDVVFDGNTPTYAFTNASYEVTRRCNTTMNVGQDYTFYIVLPAGEYSLIEIKAYVASEIGEVLYKSRRASLTIKPGMIANAGADFEIELIEPEPPHAYKVGDVYPYSPEGETVTPQGIVFEVAADGLSGKIVAIDEPSVAVWSTVSGNFNSTAIAGDVANGITNMDAIVSSSYGVNLFPAFNECKTFGSDSDIEWYLPARAELSTIVDNYTALNRKWTELHPNANPDSDWFMPQDSYWTSYATLVRGAASITYFEFDANAATFVSKTVADRSLEKGVLPIAQFESK